MYTFEVFMLVWSIRRILHDANIHRLSNRYANRLSCFGKFGCKRVFMLEPPESLR